MTRKITPKNIKHDQNNRETTKTMIEQVVEQLNTQTLKQKQNYGNITNIQQQNKTYSKNKNTDIPQKQ